MLRQHFGSSKVPGITGGTGKMQVVMEQRLRYCGSNRLLGDAYAAGLCPTVSGEGVGSGLSSPEKRELTTVS